MSLCRAIRGNRATRAFSHGNTSRMLMLHFACQKGWLWIEEESRIP